MAATSTMASVCTSSLDREKEWNQCCARIMGFEWVDQFEEEEGASPAPIQQIINLMDDEDWEGEQEERTVGLISSLQPQDHWSENARRIQTDLTHMSRWIQRKQHDYISLEMRDDEASLIQSTVTSFAATTASEIETLRKMIASASNSSHNNNMAGHRAGVVQILLAQLQEQVTEPFRRLQKQRTRIAVQLWQAPLQCKLYHPKPSSSDSTKGGSMMEFFDDEPDKAGRDQRFLPRKAPPNRFVDHTFLSTYGPASSIAKRSPPPRPDFLSRLASRRNHTAEGAWDVAPDGMDTDSQSRTKPQTLVAPQQPPRIPSQVIPVSEEETRRQLEEDLQREAVALLVAVNNDLEGVQKVEQRMNEITTLIGQFANLVSEQQEEIAQIHDSAETAKDNMEKGQENLVDAAERTKKSRNYTAWVIFAMSMTLLFFHTLKN